MNFAGSLVEEPPLHAQINSAQTADRIAVNFLIGVSSVDLPTDVVFPGGNRVNTSPSFVYAE
jgi:hypothetical protein